MSSRRAFLRHGGLAAVVLPVAGARAVLEVGKEPPPQLAHVQTGGLLTAEWMNLLVDAINELRAERHG